LRAVTRLGLKALLVRLEFMALLTAVLRFSAALKITSAPRPSKKLAWGA